jgi:hypothetical protein
MIIIGAGMAGLLAGNMLRVQHNPGIMEAASALPNNHSAVLRFRSSVVSDVIGIEFRKVRVMRAVQPWQNAIADAIAYSVKCNGVADMRSIMAADGSVVDRFIAPPDLIQRMAAGLPEDSITFNFKVESFLIKGWRRHKQPIISTIPMPAAMDLLGWEGDRPEFRFRHGANIVATLSGVSFFASLYVPNPSFIGSRISITGNEMIIECPGEDAEELAAKEAAGGFVESLLVEACQMMGLPPRVVEHFAIKPQRYAKILPIDEQTRKAFIMWASDRFGFYSLGRFATWRPGLLLDDVVHDVRVIQRIISGDSSARYSSRKGGNRQ